MSVPESLYYTADHEWVDDRGDVVRVGITQYAQDALGDVVFVQLPDTGAIARAGEALGEVESTKSVSDVFAPVSGSVVAVNSTLADRPELLNQDPYGEGWLFEIQPATPNWNNGLMDAGAYRSLIGG
jgi:glycine cleavage system H protein